MHKRPEETAGKARDGVVVIEKGGDRFITNLIKKFRKKNESIL